MRTTYHILIWVVSDCHDPLSRSSTSKVDGRIQEHKDQKAGRASFDAELHFPGVQGGAAAEGEEDMVAAAVEDTSRLQRSFVRMWIASARLARRRVLRRQGLTPRAACTHSLSPRSSLGGA